MSRSPARQAYGQVRTVRRHGPEAKQFTVNLVNGKTVTVKVKERDRYGRLVGEVFIEGTSLNRELARNGWAWWYDHFAKEDLDLQRLQAAAKSAGKGLWANPSPIPPWDWRRDH